MTHTLLACVTDRGLYFIANAAGVVGACACIAWAVRGMAGR